MLGWYIIIAQQTPEERDKSPKDSKDDAVLANWETGLGGTQWLDKLTQEGKAIQLSENGYPNRYTAKAKDVLPLIINGIPENVTIFMPVNWKGKIVKFDDKIAACSPEQTLTIDAWDQS